MEELIKKAPLEMILEATKECDSKLNNPDIDSDQDFWRPVNIQRLNDAVWGFIADAYVTASPFGVIKFVFIDGTCQQFVLSSSSKKLIPGEKISLNNECWLITLKRGGRTCQIIKVIR